MACNAGMKMAMPLSYTVPVPVQTNYFVPYGDELDIGCVNVNRSDILFNKTPPIAVFEDGVVNALLRDTDKQKWGDDTTAPKTYNVRWIPVEPIEFGIGDVLHFYNDAGQLKQATCWDINNNYALMVTNAVYNSKWLGKNEISKENSQLGTLKGAAKNIYQFKVNDNSVNASTMSVYGLSNVFENDKASDICNYLWDTIGSGVWLGTSYSDQAVYSSSHGTYKGITYQYATNNAQNVFSFHMELSKLNLIPRSS